MKHRWSGFRRRGLWWPMAIIHNLPQIYRKKGKKNANQYKNKDKTLFKLKVKCIEDESKTQAVNKMKVKTKIKQNKNETKF